MRNAYTEPETATTVAYDDMRLVDLLRVSA